MEQFYKADSRTFPGNGAISITFSPVSEGNAEYQTDLPIEGSVLEGFLKKLGLSLDGETPYNQYSQLASDIQGSNEVSFFTSKSSLDNLIDRFSSDDFDPMAYPEEDEVIIIEKIKLVSPLQVNNKIYEAGTSLKFWHKGRV